MLLFVLRLTTTTPSHIFSICLQDTHGEPYFRCLLYLWFILISMIDSHYIVSLFEIHCLRVYLVSVISVPQTAGNQFLNLILM
jgi:hypothetical protein